MPPLNRSGFQLAGDSEWSCRFRQACKARSIVQRCNNRKQKSRMDSEETDLNGVVEERDGMSDEEGDEIDGEEELAAPDWRVRAGPRNKPTQRERRA